MAKTDGEQIGRRGCRSALRDTPRSGPRVRYPRKRTLTVQLCSELSPSFCSSRRKTAAGGPFNRAGDQKLHRARRVEPEDCSYFCRTARSRAAARAAGSWRDRNYDPVTALLPSVSDANGRTKVNSECRRPRHLALRQSARRWNGIIRRTRRRALPDAFTDPAN